MPRVKTWQELASDPAAPAKAVEEEETVGLTVMLLDVGSTGPTC